MSCNSNAFLGNISVSFIFQNNYRNYVIQVSNSTIQRSYRTMRIFSNASSPSIFKSRLCFYISTSNPSRRIGHAIPAGNCGYNRSHCLWGNLNGASFSASYIHLCRTTAINGDRCGINIRISVYILHDSTIRNRCPISTASNTSNVSRLCNLSIKKINSRQCVLPYTNSVFRIKHIGNVNNIVVFFACQSGLPVYQLSCGCFGISI